MKTYLQKHNKIQYSDNWSTPKEIYSKYVDELGYYDPCPLYGDDTNLKDCLFGEQTNVNKNMFVNPPYSNIEDWIDWVIEMYDKYNKNITLLIPSRTDTKYFHRLLNCNPDLEFIKGRLKFGGLDTPAPFPSVLVHLRGDSN